MSVKVVKLDPKLNVRVHPDYPFLKSEIAYAAKHEMAEKPNDIICRRVPIGFLNQNLADELLPEVVNIMGKEKKWSNAQKKTELEEAR
jgi:glycerol-3-phosphate dehydrogenase